MVSRVTIQPLDVTVSLRGAIATKQSKKIASLPAVARNDIRRELLRAELLLLPLFLIGGVPLLSGCARARGGAIPSSVEEALKPAQSAAVSEVKEKKREIVVAIVPFSEKRGNLKSYGSLYKYLIPLVPYGTIRYERPDEAKIFNTQSEFEFNMSENLLKVLVDSVKKCGLFDNVVVTPTPLVSGADLILSGDIHSTVYEGKTYSYGISFAGPVLWCLGLPAGSSHKKLHIRLMLKRRDETGVLWRYDINKEQTVIQGLYHNWGKEVNTFNALMAEGSKEAMADMKDTLSKIPFEQLKVKIPEPEPEPGPKSEPPPPPQVSQEQGVPQVPEAAQQIPEASKDPQEEPTAPSQTLPSEEKAPLPSEAPTINTTVPGINTTTQQ